MIACFNIKPDFLFPRDVLLSHFRLRYKLNIELQHWDVPIWNNEFEYDAYDNGWRFSRIQRGSGKCSAYYRSL